ncbi:hypothetical protein C725_0458 [Pacificimonas flava]|uniref:Uncharacterized protein n=2 Tax=Pacificimonas flava TaxID=1234595 RepID=M2U962_9SPHN|nr:hypothetical protein C725_0458 [Pacificimonas flava]
MTNPKSDPPPGPRANQGFGAPGSPQERDSGMDENAPAAQSSPESSRKPDMKRPAEDGLDPKSLEKTIKTDSEMIAEEQLDEDLSVTGAPPRGSRDKTGSDG